MNTKLLMRLSSVWMGVLGICAIFMPREILIHLEGGSSTAGVLMIQIVGALYFGFAMLNWMAQANLLGGIYSRPVAVGNLTHFAVAALAIVKVVLGGGQPLFFVVAALIYSVFACFFALVVLRDPTRRPVKSNV